LWRVSLSKFRVERERDRKREKRKVREAEMSLIASDIAAEEKGCEEGLGYKERRWRIVSFWS